MTKHDELCEGLRTEGNFIPLVGLANSAADAITELEAQVSELEASLTIHERGEDAGYQETLSDLTVAEARAEAAEAENVKLREALEQYESALIDIVRKGLHGGYHGRGHTLAKDARAAISKSDKSGILEDEKSVK